jgi:hypothetical protein
VTVDDDGFRKNFDLSSSYPVLVAAGSAIFGSGFSDEETLPWILSEALALSVLNGGRSPLYNTLGRPELQEVQIIIDTRVERFIKDQVFADYDYRRTDSYQPLMQRERHIWELLSAVPAQRYLITSILIRVFERIDNDMGVYVTQVPTPYRYLNHEMSMDDMNNAVNAISRRSSEIGAMRFRYISQAYLPNKLSTMNQSTVSLRPICGFWLKSSQPWVSKRSIFGTSSCRTEMPHCFTLTTLIGMRTGLRSGLRRSPPARRKRGLTHT